MVCTVMNTSLKCGVSLIKTTEATVVFRAHPSVSLAHRTRANLSSYLPAVIAHVDATAIAIQASHLAVRSFMDTPRRVSTKARNMRGMRIGFRPNAPMKSSPHSMASSVRKHSSLGFAKNSAARRWSSLGRPLGSAASLSRIFQLTKKNSSKKCWPIFSSPSAKQTLTRP